jgi:hypothetical protein
VDFARVRLSRFGSAEGGLLLFWLLSVVRFNNRVTNNNSTLIAERNAGERSLSCSIRVWALLIAASTSTLSILNAVADKIEFPLIIACLLRCDFFALHGALKHQNNLGPGY